VGTSAPTTVADSQRTLRPIRPIPAGGSGRDRRAHIGMVVPLPTRPTDSYAYTPASSSSAPNDGSRAACTPASTHKQMRHERVSAGRGSHRVRGLTLSGVTPVVGGHGGLARRIHSGTTGRPGAGNQATGSVPVRVRDPNLRTTRMSRVVSRPGVSTTLLVIRRSLVQIARATAPIFITTVFGPLILIEEGTDGQEPLPVVTTTRLPAPSWPTRG
jgi:hypothetical protein